MYQTYFGLKEALFENGIATDAAVFRSAKHDLVKAYFKLALTSPEAAVMLFGPPGVGKTTLVASALRATSTRLALAWIGTAPANANDLLELLLTESGLNAHRSTRVERLQIWRQFVNETAATESRLFVIIERTEDLSFEVLRALDGLTRADPNGNPGVNLVLLGRPGLDEFLAAPALDSLRQRVRVRQGLEPFTLEETTDYLRHAAARAGVDLGRLFAPGAVATVHRFTGGVARLINNLCETALNLAATKGDDRLSPELVARVATGLLGLGVAAPLVPSTVRTPAPTAPLETPNAAPAAGAETPEAPVAAAAVAVDPGTASPPTPAVPSKAAAAPAEVPPPPATEAKSTAAESAATAAKPPATPVTASGLGATLASSANAPPAVTDGPSPTPAKPGIVAPTAAIGPPPRPARPIAAPSATASAMPSVATQPPPRPLSRATAPSAATDDSIPATTKPAATTGSGPPPRPASRSAARPPTADAPAPKPAEPATSTPTVASEPPAGASAPTVASGATAATPAPSTVPDPSAVPTSRARPPTDQPGFDGTVTDVAFEDRIDPPLLTDAIDSEPTLTDIVGVSSELPEGIADLDAAHEDAFEAAIEAELLAALDPETGSEADVEELLETTDTGDTEPVATQPRTRVETAYAKPKRNDADQTTPTPSRQSEKLSALSAAKSLDDISSSMAETLFGESELDMLSAALASAGWPDTEEEPTVASETAKHAAAPQANATVDDSFELFDVGNDGPLELVDDSQGDPRAKSKRVSR